MSQQLSAFVEAHPNGWTHEEWVGLLQTLERDGQDVSQPDAVGLALEHERLERELRRKGVTGLGPKRINAVVDRFGTLWSLKQASVEDVAEIPTIHRSLAERLLAALRD